MTAVAQTGAEDVRGIAVVDVGSTHTKLILFDAGLTPLKQEMTASPHHRGPPYRWIDPEPVLDLVARVLPAFDRILPVDRVVPSAHGSALVLLDAAGRLALPIMDYEAEPPRAVREEYAKLEPPFAEVFAPTNPGALTLGRQLYWQESLYPGAFARTRRILPWGQYIAYRLSGTAVSEVTALGAQTHLWNVKDNRFSRLAEERSWASRFAPLAEAYHPIGKLKAEFRGDAFRGAADVLAGVHDSNANLLRYLAAGLDDFTLLSTGTWIIGFAPGADLDSLDPQFDLVSNTTVFGDPVASCRFMGGREFAHVSNGADAAAASQKALARIIEAGVHALPSFTDSGGPVPGTGGLGRIVGPANGSPAESATLAALYCALMTAESLDAVGATGSIVVDGPFAENAVFLTCLAAFVGDRQVLSSGISNGTAAGAAILALIADDGTMPDCPVDLAPVEPARHPGLLRYREAWRAAALDR